MNTDLLFDFRVDNEAQTVHITREFDAAQALVWEAFTTKELLDPWTAPDPFIAKSKYMNFEVGGKRFYAMVAPDGTENWAIQEYLSISPISHFKMFNAFADKDENPSLPGSAWEFYFSESDGITTVRISIYNESFERMSRLMDGFKLGYTATLEKLESLLEAKRR